MSGIFATAGAKIYIGNAKDAQSDDFDASDFAGESWVEIPWAENIGAFGDAAASITFDAIGEGRTQKLKGNRNAGDMQLVFGIDTSAAGQTALRAAEATKDDYAFKVEFNDAPAGGGTPSIRYFIGKVMTATEVLDTANNVVKLNATVGINSNIVRVAPTGP
jgi:hypothetical protein